MQNKTFLMQVMLTFTLLFMITGPASAEEKAAPAPVTISDPDIPLDELELKLAPIASADTETDIQKKRAFSRKPAKEIDVGEMDVSDDE